MLSITRCLVVLVSLAAGLLVVGVACLTANLLRAAEEEAEDPVLQMVVDLLGNEDKDMRALGREEPGSTLAATNLFNEDFQFYDSDLNNASIQPSRAIYGAVSIYLP